VTVAASRQRRKSIEELVSYALGHRIRLEALTILNEGVYSVQQVAAIMDEPLGTVSYHVKELHEAGSIELVKTVKVRNADEHYYRALEMPNFSDEEVAAMTPQQRQVTAGLIVQFMFAETLSALWAGKMKDDPRVCLYWQRFNVDAEARGAIADVQARAINEVQRIAEDSVNRNAGSDVETKPIVVAKLGFGRARKAPVPPLANPE